ncbi:exodeoxyribonuclease V subunit beta [Catenovulum agarivorans DS-2]|uniref:RecBCD enzyme subunit RecB n=1 Tax=Catenovulum agarivorans DS-2 TaxID=1328313 RepID=W7QEI5_9ALTE|nr:exodeoxyribonuclease V subunit beta [Catenovulum agarivorans]EWH11299.1 exodeoxyribonuclease V subunit beta [Catenovulum agarivorans DS-2]
MSQGNLLSVENMVLSGRHLIEASAGTGKTYNITRIYLRLLLEKNLSVKEILLMTFTKAATEELKGRIEKVLRETLNKWSSLADSEDEFFISLHQAVPAEAAKLKLKAALLELDEASIYTIHGFCKTVLSQQAFASQLPMQMNMEVDTSELLIQAVQDWFRTNANNQSIIDALYQYNWHTPDRFFRQFSNALKTQQQYVVATADKINQAHQAAVELWLEAINTRKKQLRHDLLAQQTDIFEALVYSKKGAEQQKRQAEWACMLAWLDNPSLEIAPKEVGDFINGNRYRNNQLISDIFAPVKALRDEYKKTAASFDAELAAYLDAADVNQIVASAIDDIRISFVQNKSIKKVLDFDDLIYLLANALNQPQAQQQLIPQLRKQYPVALIDEFQDTDTNQYQILQSLYAVDAAEHALFMIGDPKQAIYGFRGGDIFTYLAARNHADYIWVMDTNWRSNLLVIQAYNRLFHGTNIELPARDVFGFDIQYQQVNAGKKSTENVFNDNSDYQAVNYWLYQPTDEDNKVVKNKADLKTGLAIYTANEIVRLLEEVELNNRAVRPQDIAILVRTGTEAAVIKQALQQANIASVYLSESSNVFESTQAKHILFVLEALLELDNSKLINRALASDLFGYTAQQIFDLHLDNNHNQYDLVIEQLQQYRLQWQQKGIMSVLLDLMQKNYQPLPQFHERGLTNMLHLAEILQKKSIQLKHPQQLMKWFKEQVSLPQSQSEAELRLESDSHLVQIVTQHKSKGLEYPIVFIPFATEYSDPTKVANRTNYLLRYFNQATGKSDLQVGLDASALQANKLEGEAEAVRLLYVAVTRAEHRLYIGMPMHNHAEKSALAKCLDLQRTDKSKWPQQLNEIAQEQAMQGAISIKQFDSLVDDIEVKVLNNSAQSTGELPVHIFTGDIEDNWYLSSFSSLTRNSHSQIKQIERHDEFNLKQLASPAEPAVEPIQNELRFTLKKGADAGNLLHDILEHSDFSKQNWSEVSEAPLSRFAQLPEEQHQYLYAWLDEVVQTPLPLMNLDGSPTGEHFCLADLHFNQTLREAEFYFPLNYLNIFKLNKILAQHRQEQHAHYLLQTNAIKGMMHGFIDLIFEYQGKYYVADYKSTHLGNQLADYGFEQLKLNNQSHYYDLQYLIYSVALHRYLQNRLPTYNYKEHFGGVYYLYLRGMKAAEQSLGDYYGVYYNTIELKVIESLDNLMADCQLEEQQTGEDRGQISLF